MKLKSAASILSAFALSACGQGGAASGAGGDPYAGVDAEIRAWRAAIESENPLCAAKVEGQGCEAFEVACKGARELTPADRAAGVSARLVAAMIFQGREPDGSTSRPGSAFATFTKADGTWTRTESEPVNLSTCAPF